MSLLCLFGAHRPSVASVARRGDHLVGICEHCARPLTRSVQSKWEAAEPLYAQAEPGLNRS